MKLSSRQEALYEVVNVKEMCIRFFPILTSACCSYHSGVVGRLMAKVSVV